VLDTRTPSVARAYDHLLGGEASFAADRALAGRLVALYPRLPDLLTASRTQVAEAVARIARHGVDQYLDVGAGLPTRPSTHATAQAQQPAARVVYIDRDPVVVTHATDLVPAGVRYQDGDLTEPESLLATLEYRPASAAPASAAPAGASPTRATPSAHVPPVTHESRGFIDFSRPVCLVLALIVQALEPGTARSVVGVLVKALAPGSCLVATAGAGDAGRLPDSVWPSGATEADLAAFFGGLDLLPPGITRHGDVLCGVGVKPYQGRPRG
jgi:S-adenosyl methyltransferase